MVVFTFIRHTVIQFTYSEQVISVLFYIHLRCSSNPKVLPYDYIIFNMFGLLLLVNKIILQCKFET